MKKGDSSALKLSYNHGSMNKGGLPRGQKMKDSYGKDSSSYVGTKAHECCGDMGGSDSNLSHSLSGGSAKQRG